MATFIEISPDAFATTFKQIADTSRQARAPGNAISRTGKDGVRRPVRGIQIKENSVVSMQVRTFDGKNIPLIDAGGTVSNPNDQNTGWSNVYTNFLINTVEESREEKMQIVETFGESFFFFYGEHARVISLSGVLLNTEDFNWRAEFWANYDNYLRGTRCVQTKSRVYLSWDDIVVGGYMMKAAATNNSEAPYHVPFSVQVVLTDYANVSRIGFPDFPKGAQEVNLDPSSLDTTNEGVGNLVSDTLAVRQLNQDAVGATSLLATIRGGLSLTVNLGASIGIGISAGAGSDEQLAVDTGDQGGLGIGIGIGFGSGGFALSINLGASLLSGRNVRVPLGFGGGSVFDEVQVALASTLRNNGQILLNSQIGDLEFAIQGQILPKTLPTHYGKITENTDEYIFRIPKSPGQPKELQDLFEDQKADDATVTDEMALIFEAFGISVDPPAAVIGAAVGVGFATISVGVSI